MTRQLTVRGVPEEVSRKLKRLSREHGRSVNATVLAILEEAVGEEPRLERLLRYATWTEADLAEFEAATAGQRVIDESAWR